MDEEEAYLRDVDRMVNEGLGGGEVTIDNGYVGDIPLEGLIMEGKDEVIASEDMGILDDDTERESI